MAITEERSDTNAPMAAPLATLARPESGWWVLLALLALLGIVGSIVVVWWRATPGAPTALERYYPLADGVTLSYRIVNQNGTISYQSENIERLQGSRASSQLDSATFVRALEFIAPETAPGAEPAQRTAPAANTASLTLARVTDITYDAGGITRTTSLMVPKPEAAYGLSINGLAFDPPLPLLDAQMAIGDQRIVTGTVEQRYPYTATLALEAAEPIDTPIGHLEDCRRARLNLQLPWYDGYSRTWYCAGVGIARQEAGNTSEPGVQRYELIGAHVPGLVAGIPPQAPTSNVSAQPQAVWSVPISGTLETLWSYQERGGAIGITTPPLPAGDLLIYGTQNGGLIALNRANRTLAWRFQAGAAIAAAPVRTLYALDLASGAFRWAFATGDAITAAPAVANNLVYVGSEDRTLYALDARSGHERWRYTTGDAIAATPAVAAGVVYLGSDDGALYALDGASGTARWAFATDGAITSAPIVADGIVYIGSHDGVLYALKTDTPRENGELIWSYDSRAAIEHSLVLSNGALYLANADNEIHALDAATGTERWRYRADGLLYGAPLALGDQIAITGAGRLLLLDARSGAARPSTSIGDASSYSGASSDGRQVFVGDWNGYIQAIGSGGTQPWASVPRWQAGALRAHLTAAADSFGSGPAADGDHLIFVTIAGAVYRLAMSDGSYEQLGQITGGSNILTPPTVADGSVYVLDVRGALIAFDLRARQERWRAETGGFGLSRPKIADGRVLLAVSQGRVTSAYAFDAQSGRQLWRQPFEDSPTIGSNLLHDGRFYVAAGALRALDPATGTVLWSTADAVAPDQIVQLDGVIYGIGYDNQGQPALIGWDASSGQQRMRTSIVIPTFPNLRGALVGGAERVAILLDDGTLLAYDTGSGAEAWRQPPISEPRGTPVIAGTAVLVVTKHNHLLAYALEDGRLLGDLTLPNENALQDFSSMAPLLLDQTIYLALGNTAVALDLKEAR
jgi:eukaryotic-like serine/threonine-protein kinase